MATKSPSVLFYTSDFLTGTAMMSNDQVGKYIRLLCYQHQMGHLLEKHMMKICGSYDQDIFSKFEKDSDGMYYNERMDIEIQKRNNYSQSRASNKLGKLKSAENQEDTGVTKESHENHMKNICESYEKHMDNDNNTSNKISNKDNYKYSKKENNKRKCLFKNSIYYNNIKQIILDIGFKYLQYDFVKYHDALLNWSDKEGKMHVDWIATIRTWILRDESQFAISDTAAREQIKNLCPEIKEKIDAFKDDIRQSVSKSGRLPENKMPEIKALSAIGLIDTTKLMSYVSANKKEK